MAQSRKKGYKSRRERYSIVKRNTKLILLFAAIAAVVYLIMIRQEIFDYLKTYSY